MPVAVFSEVADATLDLYREVNRRLDLQERAPGHLLHCVCELPDGGLRVFDVWESEDAFRRYERERLAPAVLAVTGGGVGPPRRQILPIASLRGLPGRAAHPRGAVQASASIAPGQTRDP